MKWLSVLVIVLGLLVSSCKKESTALPEVTVLGHAGTSLHRDRAVFPANSFESIKYAIDILDADGVEVDVQMTRDSILVLYHDQFLDFSTNMTGCVSEYSFEELKMAKLDNSNYNLIDLEQVLKFVESRKKSVFLDVKTYDFCKKKNISISAFEYALSNCKSKLSSNFNSKITLSSESTWFLNQINHTIKCIEVEDVKNGIEKINSFGFQSFLIKLEDISESDVEVLKTISWGLQGVKDEWTVDDGIKLLPKFVITDNIAYTRKVTN